MDRFFKSRGVVLVLAGMVAALAVNVVAFATRTTSIVRVPDWVDNAAAGLHFTVPAVQVAYDVQAITWAAVVAAVVVAVLCERFDAQRGLREDG